MIRIVVPGMAVSPGGSVSLTIIIMAGHIVLPAAKCRGIGCLPVTLIRMGVYNLLSSTSSPVSGTTTRHSVLTAAFFPHALRTATAFSVSRRGSASAATGNEQDSLAV